jgi:hypothetical protein
LLGCIDPASDVIAAAAAVACLLLQLLERLGAFFASLHAQRQAEVLKMDEAAAEVRKTADTLLLVLVGLLPQMSCVTVLVSGWH